MVIRLSTFVTPGAAHLDVVRDAPQTADALNGSLGAGNQQSDDTQAPRRVT
jgi:hypothetical protein